jgi:uncharacterized RDD family membrane protein YckC
MRLHPNPPRLITVAIALALGVIGFIVVWPVAEALPFLAPIDQLLGTVGLGLDRDLGFLFLLACPSLLVVGSLVPGI